MLTIVRAEGEGVAQNRRPSRQDAFVAVKLLFPALQLEVTELVLSEKSLKILLKGRIKVKFDSKGEKKFPTDVPATVQLRACFLEGASIRQRR